MKKKILIIQLRSKLYAEHEKVCFKRNYREYYDHMVFKNITKSSVKLPKTLKDLKAYSCIIIAGSGEYSLSENQDHGAKNPPKSLYNLMQSTIKYDYPFFGLCFGHQLLAKVLDSKILSDKKQAEVGSYLFHKSLEAKEDKLFSKLSDKFYVQQGHNDSVMTVPDNSVLMGSSEKCKVQALKCKENLYSTQFHAEMTSKESWERDKLYNKLNPGLGYKTKTPEPKDSKDQTKILKLFLSYYCR